MLKKILGAGSGVGVNDTHTEVPPVILVHNTEPFDDRDTAISALKQKILHPGEVAVVYYVDAGADDGVSSIIATGPLYQGGQNEIFSSASQIDDLAEYLKAQIDAQNAHFEEFAEQLKVEIAREVSEFKEQLIIENRAMINSAIAEINEKVDTSLAEIKSEIEEEIDDKIAIVDASIAFNSSVLASAIIELQTESRQSDASLRELIDDSYSELVSMVKDGDAAVDASLRNYIDPIVSGINEEVSTRDAAIRTDMHNADAVLADEIEDVSRNLFIEKQQRILQFRLALG